MRLVLARMPDFRFRALCWRANGSNVFVEAHNAATVDDRPVEWLAVYRLVLGEAGVVRGRRYYGRCIRSSWPALLLRWRTPQRPIAMPQPASSRRPPDRRDRHRCGD